MKILTCVVTLVVLAQGAPTPDPHYTFPNIVGTAQWANVRQWTGYQGNGPVTSVDSTDIRCNVNGDKNFAKGTTSIAAGTTTGFNSNQAIFHYGPALAYLAKVPAGKTAATWDGSGTAWFKIYEERPTVGNGQLNWPSYNAQKISFKIPAATPPGEYLLRIEHIALHQASQLNGAQFYISCAQVTITGNGAGTPGPLVAFPGAYKATDPGIHYNINPPVKNDYVPPGPAIWTG